eukprot:3740708-Rhodomonas_salina.2
MVEDVLWKQQVRSTVRVEVLRDQGRVLQTRGWAAPSEREIATAQETETERDGERPRRSDHN